MVYIDGLKVKPDSKIIDDVKIQVVYLPLESKLGYKYKPTVKVMDYVYIGDIVGINKIADFPLLSSVSGTVVGFSKKYISNGKYVECIVIENDFKERYRKKIGVKKDITLYNKKEFIYMLRENAISGMSGSDYPTYLKYDNDQDIKCLIVNGVESDIYSSSDNAIMYKYYDEILEGIDAILSIMDIDKAYVCINENNTKVINKFLKRINTYPNIKIFPITDAYPSGWERNLVKEVLGVSYNDSPMEVKTIINNVSTIYSIYTLLKYGKPITDRIVTLCGNGLKKNGNYNIKIGTNFSEYISKINGYKDIYDRVIIVGGGLMGVNIPSDELIITRDVNTIIVGDKHEFKREECIRCGKCNEVCPVGLMPALIMENKDKAKLFKSYKCIKCGLCSYVCPAKIDIRCEVISTMEDQ